MRETRARADLRLHEGLAEGVTHAHHLAGGLHLGAQNGVDTRELDERKHRFLDAEIRRVDFPRDALRGQRLPGHATRSHLRQLDAGGLADKRHRAAGARVDLQHIDHVLPVHMLDGELHVHQAHHVQAVGHGARLALDFFHRGSTQAVGRQRTGRVAAVHAGLFDVLHHAADEGGAGGVADAVHVTLDGVVEETVQQHG